MKHILIGAVIISSLGGSYYLLNPEETKTDSALESIAESNAAQQKNPVNFLPIAYQNSKKAQAVTAHNPVTKNKRPPDLEKLVSNPLANKAMISENIAAIAQCSSCLESLKHTLLTANLSREDLSELSSTLTHGNHPEIAQMLLSITAQMITESGNNENTDTLISTLASFNSPKVAKVFADTLTSSEFDTENLNNGELGSSLRKNINQMTARQEVGAELAGLYFQTNDIKQQEKLLAIQQPESLVQISSTLMTQGNQQAANAILEQQLQNNPSAYTADALLKLARSQQSDPSQSTNVTELASNWARQNAQNEAVKIMENKLVEGNLSSSEENLVVTMLQDSPDKSGKTVLAKYQSYKTQVN